MKKKLFSVFLMCFFVSWVISQLWAVTAIPTSVTLTQPDGTKITVYLKGDERVNWMETLDGYTLMYDSQKNVVYATTDKEGNMVPSNIKYSEFSLRSSGIVQQFLTKTKKGLRYSPPQVSMMKQIWEITDSQIQYAPAVGNKKALCILMGFADKDFTKTRQDFEMLMNQLGYNANNAQGSVKDFYKENSYGQLDLTVTVAGPYKAQKNMAYYGQDSGNNHNLNVRELIIEAANAANADVNYLDFANSSNQLENFHVIFAGYGQEAGGGIDCIWSHKWQLVSPITLDGVRVSIYSCSPELSGNSGNSITNIGVICHELCHVFGAPDFYDADYGDSGGDYPGTGEWDLMASGSWNNGGITPAHINMFQKIVYGWVTPVELSTETTVTDMLNSAKNPEAYIIKTNDNGECYVLENRQKVGFDANVPGHGLLIYHVHQAAANGSVNNRTHPQSVYPVCASSSTAIPTAVVSTYGDVNSAGCPFPGTSGKTSFTDMSTPQAFSWTGLAGIGKPITHITESIDKISFKFMESTEPVSNLQVSVTGDQATLTWTAPTAETLVGYRIYRDDALVYTITDKSVTTFSNNGLANGTYKYCVTAVHSITESSKVCVDAVVTDGLSAYCLPAKNLKANIKGEHVGLTWEAPFTGGWLTFAGAAYTSYSYGQVNPDLTIANRWSTADLKGLNGYTLTKVRFYAGANLPAGTTYTIGVWTVTDGGEPILVYSQDLQNTFDNFELNEITLNQPVSIDASKELMVSLQCGAASGYPFVADIGPAVNGKGNMMHHPDDGWFTTLDIDAEGNFNWCISAYLDSQDAPSPVVLNPVNDKSESKPAYIKSVADKGKLQAIQSPLTLLSNDPQNAPGITRYNIYRNGTLLGTSTTTSYLDETASANTTYNYCVEVAYANDCKSEQICVEARTQEPPSPYNSIVNLKANPVSTNVNLTWEAPFSGGWMSYVNTTVTSFANAVTGTTTDYSIASRWSADDLKQMNGYKLSKIRFGIHPAANVDASKCTYYLRVWTKDDSQEPVLVREQELTSYTIGAWNEIALNTPLDIDVYKELWVGVRIVRLQTTPSNFPATFGIGNLADGKGNMYYTNGAWNSWSNVTTGSTRNYNWALGAMLEPSDGGSPIILNPIADNSVNSASMPEVSLSEVNAAIDNSEPEYVPTLTGYNIHRNGVKINASPITDIQYTDANVEPGTYEYCVTAVYAGGESERVCTQATVVVPPTIHQPISNLALAEEVTSKTVALEWDAPLLSSLIGYSSGTTLRSVGTGNPVDFDIAARWTPEDLENKNIGGYLLTKVRFVPALAKANCTYSVRVWRGGDAFAPGELIVDQVISSQIVGTWNEITLNAPVTIDPSKELWIGIRCNNSSTGNPGPMDAGPAVSGKGNMMYFNNVWQQASDLAVTLDGNWFVAGFVELPDSDAAPIELTPIADATNRQTTGTLNATEEVSIESIDLPLWIPTLVEYNVYRDGVVVGTVTQTNFTEDVAEFGDYNYCVTAVYSDNVESEKICLSVLVPPTCKQVTDLTATLNDNTVTIEWTDAKNIGNYNIYRNDELIAIGVTDIQYDDVLTAAGDYTYCVTSVTQDCESDPVCATPISLVYNPAQNLLASVNEKDVTLTWEIPVTGTPAGYNVYRDNALLANVNTLTYADNALEAGTYNYCVKAVYTSSDIESDAVCAEAVVLPSKVLSLDGTQTGGVVSLTWTDTDNSGTTAYNIYRNDVKVATITPPQTSFSETLSAHGTYEYCVTAVVGSLESLRQCYTINLVCNPITNLHVNISGTNVRLSWTKNNASETFNVYRDGVKIATTSNQTYDDSGLNYGASYYYYVSAVTSDCESVNTGIYAHMQNPPTPIVILTQPVGANICEGEGYTFKVKAEGENLTYQWYKGNNPIFGAVKSELTITNATFNDYENYYVTVGSDNQTVTSNTVRLWVASKLPAQLVLTQYPDPAISGKTYLVRLNGYADVTKYSWSYSRPGVTFLKAITTENEVNVTFAPEAVGKGILTVNLDHVCGNRAVTQEIQVNYPVGIDEVGAGKVRIYPNPVADVLNVTSDKSEVTNLEITDVNGRLVYKVQPKVTEYSLNVSHWPKGVYLVKITTESGTSVYKVVKK